MFKSISPPLIIGNSVQTIDSNAFENCFGLTTIDCYTNDDVFGTDSLLGSNVTVIHVPVGSAWVAGNQNVGGVSMNVIKDL